MQHLQMWPCDRSGQRWSTPCKGTRLSPSPAYTFQTHTRQHPHHSAPRTSPVPWIRAYLHSMNTVRITTQSHSTPMTYGWLIFYLMNICGLHHISAIHSSAINGCGCLRVSLFHAVYVTINHKCSCKAIITSTLNSPLRNWTKTIHCAHGYTPALCKYIYTHNCVVTDWVLSLLKSCSDQAINSQQQWHHYH